MLHEASGSDEWDGRGRGGVFAVVSGGAIWTWRLFGRTETTIAASDERRERSKEGG
jgi:hypothetical protein